MITFLALIRVVNQICHVTRFVTYELDALNNLLAFNSMAGQFDPNIIGCTKFETSSKLVGN